MKPPISPQARSAYEAVCRPYDRCVEPPFALRREPGTIDRQLRELITKRNQRRCLPNSGSYGRIEFTLEPGVLLDQLPPIGAPNAQLAGLLLHPGQRRSVLFQQPSRVGSSPPRSHGALWRHISRLFRSRRVFRLSIPSRAARALDGRTHELALIQQSLHSLLSLSNQ